MERNNEKGNQMTKSITDIDARIEACIVRSARGSYQMDILRGRARLSGADLQGRARQYSGRYSLSRDAVIRRFRAAIAWEFNGRVTCEGRKTKTGLKYFVLVDDTGNVVYTA